MGDEVVGGIRDEIGGIGDEIGEIGDEIGEFGDAIDAKRIMAEAGARVADVEDERSAGSDGGDFDHLLGIEGGTVLHGVEKDLAEAEHDLISHIALQLGAEFSGKGHKALGGEEAAVGADSDPAGAGGDDADVVVLEAA